MHKHKAELPELTLVGLTLRTNNNDEMNPNTSKIAELAEHYWTSHVADGIKHRSQPGVIYSVYTDYESDEHGEYTYFLGEAVDSLDDQDLKQFKTITIPADVITY